MHFDRAHADFQDCRNLTVRLPARHERKDVTLPRREEVGVAFLLQGLDFVDQAVFSLIINRSSSTHASLATYESL